MTTLTQILNDEVTLDQMFDGDTLVDDDVFLDASNDDRIQFPGDLPEAVVSPKQARSVLIGFRTQAMADVSRGYGNKTLAEIVKLERRRLNLSDSQWFGTNAVERYIADSRAESAHLPLTEAQQRVAADFMGAYLGTQPHYDNEVQARINNVPQLIKDKMFNLWFDVTTRGEFQAALTKNAAIAGNPAANAASQRRTQTQNLVANMMEQGEDEEEQTPAEGAF